MKTFQILISLTITLTVSGCLLPSGTTSVSTNPREEGCRDLERHILMTEQPSQNTSNKASDAYKYCLAGLSSPQTVPQSSGRPANVDMICTNIGNGQVRCVNKK